MSPLNQVLTGIRRHKIILLRSFLEALGAIWLVLEATSFFYTPARQIFEGNPWALIAATLIAALYAMWRARTPNTITIAVAGSNTNVIVKFGNLFDTKDEHIIVPVNNHFDGELGVTVAHASVHGQLIQRSFDGAGKEFEKACDSQLRGIESTNTPERARRKKAYPIGTAVALPLDGRKAVVFALTETNPVTHKVRADVYTMWQALDGLWRCVRDNSNGHAANLPLVGAGQSGVGIAPAHLLRFIILSIQAASQKQEVCKTIRIILHPEFADRIDLHSVKKDWR